MAPWKTHFDIGTRVFGQLRYRIRSRPQRDHPTTLHALPVKPTIQPESALRAELLFDGWRGISTGDSTFERESDFGVSYPSDEECPQTRPAKLPAVLSDLD